MSDWTVKIEYKNENLETVVEKEYDLISYTAMLHLELMRLIMEIEESFCALTGKDKDDWDEETKARFKKIRHKMLDQANAIRRLPQNLTFQGVSPVSIDATEYFLPKK